MDEGQDLYLGRRHLVEQAVSLNEELPDVGLGEFGNNAAPLAEDLKRRSRLQLLNQQALSSRA